MLQSLVKDYFLLRVHAIQGVGEEDFKRLGGDDLNQPFISLRKGVRPFYTKLTFPIHVNGNMNHPSPL